MVNRSFLNPKKIYKTFACIALALFGAVIGLIFAVLCMTIGVGKALGIGIFCLIGAFIGGVKDKTGFVRRIILFFHREEN